MTKIPIKTRLPAKAWALAALVTLFSLLSTLIHTQLIPEKIELAHALMSGEDSAVTSSIR